MTSCSRELACNVPTAGTVSGRSRIKWLVVLVLALLGWSDTSALRLVEICLIDEVVVSRNGGGMVATEADTRQSPGGQTLGGGGHLEVTNASHATPIPPRESDSTGGRTLYVSSGRCTGLGRDEARQAAENAAHQKLLQALNQMADELCGRKLPNRLLEQELAWLRSQQQVDYRESWWEDVRQYGDVAEKTLELRLPQAVVAEWTRRLERLQSEWVRSLVAGLAAMVVAWIAGLIGMVWVDRVTGGYYRPMVLVGGPTALLLVSMLIWLAVVRAV